MADELKEQFLLEIRSDRSRRMSETLTREYLQVENTQRRMVAMIKESLKCRRDCYPYTPVSHLIKKRIGLFQYMIIE
jgi:hypothetical protein